MKRLDKRVVDDPHAPRLPLARLAPDSRDREVPQLPIYMPPAIHARADRVAALCEVVPEGPLLSVHPDFSGIEPVILCNYSDHGVRLDRVGEGNHGITYYVPNVFSHAMDPDVLNQPIDEGFNIMGHCFMPSKPDEKV